MNKHVSPIAGYNHYFRNRSMHMSDSLQTFSVFDQRPAIDFIDGWRQHIADTGAPESFQHVSTTKPDKAASVVLLSEEIIIPTARRSGGDRVPCPICSPKSGKFGKGRMAYFPDDSAVRFIGHDCSKKYLGSSYTEADRLFRIEAQCAAIIQLWPKLQAALPQINPIVQSLYAVGQRVGQIRAMIDVQAPGFAKSFHGDLVSIGARVVASRVEGAQKETVRGIEFLSEGFSPDSESGRLMAVCRDLRSPLPSWSIGEGDSAASKEIGKRGRSATLRLRELSVLRDLLEETGQFLDVANLRLLERWRASGNSPFTIIRFVRDGERIQGLVESYAGRFEWSVIFPADLLKNLPKKEDIAALDLMEMIG